MGCIWSSKASPEKCYRCGEICDSVLTGDLCENCQYRRRLEALRSLHAYDTRIETASSRQRIATTVAPTYVPRTSRCPQRSITPTNSQAAYSTKRTATTHGAPRAGRPQRSITPTNLKSKEQSFGEFKCSSCGRRWCSRLSWADAYQICKKCRSRVLPHSLRAVLPSDMSGENAPEHPKELCQKCQQLGYYCAKFRRSVSASR